MSAQRWKDAANCRGVDPELFFPARGDPTAYAKAVCKGCVVRDECLAYALANGEKFGIWGQMSERERRRIRRAGSLARNHARTDTPESVAKSEPVPPLVAQVLDAAAANTDDVGIVVDLCAVVALAFDVDVDVDGDVIMRSVADRAAEFPLTLAAVSADMVAAVADGLFESPEAAVESLVVQLGWRQPAEAPAPTLVGTITTVATSARRRPSRRGLPVTIGRAVHRRHQASLIDEEPDEAFTMSTVIGARRSAAAAMVIR